MQFIITDIKLKYDQHKTLVLMLVQPNFFERTFLRMKPRTLTLIGHRSKWQTFPDFGEPGKKISEQLHAAEQRWEFVKRQNPRASFTAVAAVVNKQLLKQS